MAAQDLEQRIRQQTVHDHCDPQGHHVQLRILVQVIQLKHLLPGLDRTVAIRQPFRIGAGEGLMAHGIRREVGHHVLHGGEMVDRLEYVVEIENQHAAHDCCDGQEDRGNVDGEADVVEDGAKDNAEGFAAVDHGEAVEGADKDHPDALF